MSPEQFCAKYGYELKKGKVSFSKKNVYKFISIYTHLKPTDFNSEMYKRLKFYMIDLYSIGLSYSYENEIPAYKIALSDFILCISN